jgi:TonB C terminal
MTNSSVRISGPTFSRWPRRANWRAGLVASVITLTLHGLIFSSFYLVGGLPSVRRPDLVGFGATAAGTGDQAAMTMILIDVPGEIADPRETQMPRDSQGPKSTSPLVKIVGVDATPPAPFASADDGEVTATPTETVATAAQRAVLFGRYEGQIRARVERAWVRPRSRIAEELFTCTVKLLQDKLGNVKEVEIVRCNGTIAWQVSLANALQGASPLPAPPDPNVFVDSLTLTFSSTPFTAGGSEQGFEPEPQVRVASLIQPLSQQGAGQFTGTLPESIRLAISTDAMSSDTAPPESTLQ